jgi:hypothetical protein
MIAAVNGEGSGSMRKTSWIAIALGVVLVALGGAARAGTLHPQSGARFHYGPPGATRPAGVGAEIYSMDADGSNQTNLTNETLDDQYSAWSPDGTQIAYTQFGNDAEIFVMNADGSNQHDLSKTPRRRTTTRPGRPTARRSPSPGPPSRRVSTSG